MSTPPPISKEHPLLFEQIPASQETRNGMRMVLFSNNSTNIQVWGLYRNDSFQVYEAEMVEWSEESQDWVTGEVLTPDGGVRVYGVTHVFNPFNGRLVALEACKERKEK